VSRSSWSRAALLAVATVASTFAAAEPETAPGPVLGWPEVAAAVDRHPALLVATAR